MLHESSSLEIWRFSFTQVFGSMLQSLTEGGETVTSMDPPSVSTGRLVVLHWEGTRGLIEEVVVHTSSSRSEVFKVVL